MYVCFYMVLVKRPAIRKKGKQDRIEPGMSRLLVETFYTH